MVLILSLARSEPAFPGETKTWPTEFDWANFQDSASSRLPLPTTNTLAAIT